MEAIGWQRQRNHYYRTGQNRCSNIIAGQEACKQITWTCSRQQQHVNTVFWRLYLCTLVTVVSLDLAGVSVEKREGEKNV